MVTSLNSKTLESSLPTLLQGATYQGDSWVGASQGEWPDFKWVMETSHSPPWRKQTVPSVVVTSFWGWHPPPAFPHCNGGDISHLRFPSDPSLDLLIPLPLGLGSSPTLFYSSVCFSFHFSLYSCLFLFLLFYLFTYHFSFLALLSFYFMCMFLLPLSLCPAVGSGYSPGPF